MLDEPSDLVSVTTFITRINEHRSALHGTSRFGFAGDTLCAEYRTRAFKVVPPLFSDLANTRHINLHISR